MLTLLVASLMLTIIVCAIPHAHNACLHGDADARSGFAAASRQQDKSPGTAGMPASAPTGKSV